MVRIAMHLVLRRPMWLVRPHRLPEGLGDENPRGTWRCIDGAWTQGPVPAKDA